MNQDSLLITIGVLFLAGLALESVGRRIHVPRVSLLILLGVAVGESGFDLLPEDVVGQADFLAPTALTMVAFLLGGGLERRTLRLQGRAILLSSAIVVAASVSVVALGLAFVGYPLAMALLLGGISAATDPAATQDVVRQSNASGPFSRNILGIVAVDDGWGVLAFSLVLAGLGLLNGVEAGEAIWHGLREIGGAVALGIVLGWPAAMLTGRIKPGEPTLIEALGIVFLCTGLALYLEISFLLTGMVCGATIANVARHHDRPFHEIERIEWPFLLLFFILAGASLEIAGVQSVVPIAIAYVLLRVLARVLGGMIGARAGGMTPRDGRYLGIALMPQAGVAIGMALFASERFPDYAQQLLAVTIVSTVVFEVVGPILTQFALSRTNGRATGGDVQ